MNTTSLEPLRLTSVRHDGWTGEAIAKFLETLADTGIVLEACDAAGKSSTAAYALRRREPLFGEAWLTALGIARDRLADTLLGRAIEGNVERIIKDGVIVAEKHFLDNRLALAVLKRLDLRADLARRPLSPSHPGSEPDWEQALTALRTGEAGAISAALAMFKAAEVCEVCDPSLEDFDGASDRFDHDRVWQISDSGEWRTDFPPPPDFSGREEGDWEDEGYCRALTDEELAALVAAGIADPSEAEGVTSIEADEAERAAFFAGLAADSKRHSPDAPI